MGEMRDRLNLADFTCCHRVWFQ